MQLVAATVATNQLNAVLNGRGFLIGSRKRLHVNRLHRETLVSRTAINLITIVCPDR